jgi:hypothetical protein
MNPYGPQPQRIIRADGVHHPVDTDHNDVSPAEELWHPGGNKWQAFILYQGFYYAIDVGRTDNKLGDFMTRTFGDPAARWMYKALDEDGEVIYKECEIDPWQAL